jgi:Na+-transporting methylmalonyl-CoA/oxaloacetate decarboxylase beta subunit
MQERRSCSKLKPWIYFLMELLIFSMISFIMVKLVEYYLAYNHGVLLGMLMVGLMLYKTRAVERLEHVLERTEEVRRVKIRQRYEDVIVG